MNKKRITDFVKIQRELSERLKPRLVWDSSREASKRRRDNLRGTYFKKVHGDLI